DDFLFNGVFIKAGSGKLEDGSYCRRIIYDDFLFNGVFIKAGSGKLDDGSYCRRIIHDVFYLIKHLSNLQYNFIADKILAP
ncbi:hypothetical protein, partial [Chryseobacterium timonianum]|uniref:hypothetical protein n=1 Tax=Chryseobacterium timonianum TaxID=1805473 RepID=UPI001F4A2139